MPEANLFALRRRRRSRRPGDPREKRDNGNRETDQPQPASPALTIGSIAECREYGVGVGTPMLSWRDGGRSRPAA